MTTTSDYESNVNHNNNIYVIIENATEKFTKPLSTEEIKEKYPYLWWGGNGLGDRWANKKFNYSVIYSNKKPLLYSENMDDIIPDEILQDFLYNNKGKGIIGIFVHSIRKNIEIRPIREDIKKTIRKMSCVVCGTQETVCDHKNDFYNDDRVLNTKTQLITDFQPLCNHCNLQKKQIRKNEEKNKKLFSGKNIKRYTIYQFEFPWEKKAYDVTDINNKNGTFWFDPVEFDKNIYYYSTITMPIINEIKQRVKSKKIRFVE